jgi:hypothetical protein
VIIIFNIIGLLMVAVGFGVAYGLTRLVGSSDEDLLVITAAAAAVACDVAYRCLHPSGHWLSPTRGGSLFFLPVWLCGLLAAAWGTTHALTGESPTDVAVWITAGVVALVLLGVGIARLPPAAETARPSAVERKDWECSRCGRRNAGYLRTCAGCRLQT